jgi:hypothetical protein
MPRPRKSLCQQPGCPGVSACPECRRIRMREFMRVVRSQSHKTQSANVESANIDPVPLAETPAPALADTPVPLAVTRGPCTLCRYRGELKSNGQILCPDCARRLGVR